MKDDIDDVDPNISDGETLLFIYVCHLNVLIHLFIMLSFKVLIIFLNHGLKSLKYNFFIKI